MKIVRTPTEEQPANESGVWGPIARPEGLHVTHKGGNLPRAKYEEDFSVGLLKAIGRLLVWGRALIVFFGGILSDKLRRRDSIERRARRLRRIIEGVGSTFIKLGQQLSIRIDLIPYEYTRELESILDDVRPYLSREEVQTAVERSIGKSVAEIFAKFDPTPIGSASIACVYQAHLKTDGRKVAVKIRRPDIGRQFAADLRVLGWLIGLAEIFFIYPGFGRPFLYELRTMLFEELDFEKEARFADIFRRRVKKAGLRFVTAPRVYFEFSSKEVIVTEFATGIWLKDIIQAVESRDQRALAILKEWKIKPKKIARRLMTIGRYGSLEGLFYHADLHPSNVVVGRNSKLTMIDFGSCGSLSEKERHTWRQFFHAQANEDVHGMTKAALSLFSSIPPIDVDEFAKKLEAIFWQDLYANKSKDAAWWERTSINMWIGFFRLSQEYWIPMNLNMLRVIRLSLLADTLAARLDRKLDHWREYRRFAAGAGRRAKRRLCGRLKWFKSDEAFIRYEELLDLGFASFFRFQNTLDKSLYTLTKLEHIVAFGTHLVLRLAVQLTSVATVLVFLNSLWKYFNGETGESLLGFLAQQLFFEGWYPVVSSKWYIIYLLILLLINGRRLMIRLGHKDIRAFHDQ